MTTETICECPKCGRLHKSLQAGMPPAKGDRFFRELPPTPTIEKLTEQPMTQMSAPMPIIPPGNQMAADRIQPLPYAEGLFAATERSSRACPKCESRGAKTVRRQGNQVMLQCPVCGEQWEWKSA